MDGQTVTLEDIRAWPVTVSMEDAVRALGISRSLGHKLANDERFPCRVVHMGDRVRIVTASLLALLEGKASPGEDRREVTIMDKHSKKQPEKTQGSTPPVKGGDVD